MTVLRSTYLILCIATRISKISFLRFQRIILLEAQWWPVETLKKDHRVQNTKVLFGSFVFCLFLMLISVQQFLLLEAQLWQVKTLYEDHTSQQCFCVSLNSFLFCLFLETHYAISAQKFLLFIETQGFLWRSLCYVNTTIAHCVI